MWLHVQWVKDAIYFSNELVLTFFDIDHRFKSFDQWETIQRRIWPNTDVIVRTDVLQKKQTSSECFKLTSNRASNDTLGKRSHRGELSWEVIGYDDVINVNNRILIDLKWIYKWEPGWLSWPMLLEICFSLQEKIHRQTIIKQDRGLRSFT